LGKISAFESAAAANSPAAGVTEWGTRVSGASAAKRFLTLRKDFERVVVVEAVAEQGMLFPIVEQVAGERTWLRQFIDAVEEHGPLVVRAHVPLILDVSRQRVHELIEKGQLETITILGRDYVSFDSLERFFASDHSKGGPPRNVELRMLRRLTASQKKLKKIS
jgi:hypothetical protein